MNRVPWLTLAVLAVPPATLAMPGSGIWGAAGVWLANRADIHGAALLAGLMVGGPSLLLGRPDARS